MQNNIYMTSMSNVLNILTTNKNSSPDTEENYILHKNWIWDLREEYNYETSLIKKDDLAEFKKEWNLTNPPLIKRSSPYALRAGNISN